jgi:hypothetical protein
MIIVFPLTDCELRLLFGFFSREEVFCFPFINNIRSDILSISEMSQFPIAFSIEFEGSIVEFDEI